MTKLLLLFNFKFTMLLGGVHLPLSVDLSHFTSVCSRNCTWLCNLQLALHSVQLWNVCLISKSGEDLQSMASRWSDLAFFKLGLVIRKLSAELHWGNFRALSLREHQRENKNVSEQAQPGLLSFSPVHSVSASSVFDQLYFNSRIAVPLKS